MKLSEIIDLEERVRKKVVIPKGITDMEFRQHLTIAITEHHRLFGNIEAYREQNVVRYLQKEYGYKLNPL